MHFTTREVYIRFNIDPSDYSNPWVHSNSYSIWIFLKDWFTNSKKYMTLSFFGLVPFSIRLYFEPHDLSVSSTMSPTMNTWVLVYRYSHYFCICCIGCQLVTFYVANWYHDHWGIYSKTSPTRSVYLIFHYILKPKHLKGHLTWTFILSISQD